MERDKIQNGWIHKKGIDCSGFVQKAILEKFDLKLQEIVDLNHLLEQLLKRVNYKWVI